MQEIIRGKKVWIVGSSSPDRKACEFFRKRGALVKVAGLPEDAKPWEEEGIAKKNIPGFFGATPPSDSYDADWIISNRMKNYESFLSPLREQSRLLLTNLDWAVRYSGDRVVAITGSNGKSTTAKMVEEMLARSGVSVVLSGGSFTHYLEAAAKQPQVLLAEVNSFALEQSSDFHPSVAVLTNLVRTHRGRHAGSQAYAAAKAKIFAHQGPKDLLIFNADNEPARLLVEGARSVKLPAFIVGVPNPFEEKLPEGSCVFWKEKTIHWRGSSGEERYPTAAMKLKAQHQIENALCAVAAARHLGATPEAIQGVLEGFAGLPHCMQKVLSSKDVEWYDDAKSSNTAATSWGIWGFPEKVILITGGKENYTKYERMARAVQERVKLLILVGQSRRSMNAAFQDLTETYLVKTLEDAVRVAYSHAQKGDRVVYSPACPPEPGLFASVADRGKKFASLVRSEMENDLRDKMGRVTRF